MQRPRRSGNTPGVRRVRPIPFASGPVGLAAYVALVGPLRVLRGRWRVTGGWAFVAFLLLRTLIGW
jgi:hypothetical protein